MEVAGGVGILWGGTLYNHFSVPITYMSGLGIVLLPCPSLRSCSIPEEDQHPAEIHECWGGQEQGFSKCERAERGVWRERREEKIMSVKQTFYICSKTKLVLRRNMRQTFSRSHNSDSDFP